MAREYIVILQSVTSIPDENFTISYDWDGKRWSTLTEANLHGWKMRDSDDFNIGIVEGDTFLGLGTDEGFLIDEDAAVLHEIAAGLDMTFVPSQLATGKEIEPEEKPSDTVMLEWFCASKLSMDRYDNGDWVLYDDANLRPLVETRSKTIRDTVRAGMASGKKL